jgi:hypothetical protein
MVKPPDHPIFLKQTLKTAKYTEGGLFLMKNDEGMFQI